MSIFKKVLSVGSGKLATELNIIVDAINDKEQEFEKLSDEEIKKNFQNLSDQLNNNPLNIEVEAFAYIREAVGLLAYLREAMCLLEILFVIVWLQVAC